MGSPVSNEVAHSKIFSADTLKVSPTSVKLSVDDTQHGSPLRVILSWLNIKLSCAVGEKRAKSKYVLTVLSLISLKVYIPLNVVSVSGFSAQ